MREIMFRGKRVRSGDWRYGYYRFNGVDKHEVQWLFKPSKNRSSWTWLVDEVIPETIGQYTGLKDTKRKEIYEGDILGLKLKGGRTRRTVKNTYITCDNYYKLAIKKLCAKREVIGNLHDNPELLES